MRKIGLASSCVAGVLGVNILQTQIRNEDTYLNEENKKKPVYVLPSQEARNHPWEMEFRTLNDPEDWSFRKVRVQGVLNKTIHLVERKRDGEEGYLVFRALKTALNATTHIEPSPEKTPLPIGIMVNMGWISKKNAVHVKDVEVTYVKENSFDSELPALKPQFVSPNTGFLYNSEM